MASRPGSARCWRPRRCTSRDGFRRNGFAWVTNCWEASLAQYFLMKTGSDRLDGLRLWLSETRRRWGTARMVTLAEFGLLWRGQFADNSRLDYRFVQRGTGIGGSDAEMEIRWFMNRDFRLALLRNWQQGGAEEVIDFTAYNEPVREPQTLIRNWSLLGADQPEGPAGRRTSRGRWPRCRRPICG